MRIYPGIQTQFFLVNKQFISGLVTKVKKDSIFLDQFDIRNYRTAWGSSFLDTITRYHLAFAFTDVLGFPAKKSFRSATLPVILMAGSAGYAGLNIINAGTQNQSLTGSENLKKLGIAAAVFATGLLWKKSKKDVLELGNKYKLLFVDMSNMKK